MVEQAQILDEAQTESFVPKTSPLTTAEMWQKVEDILGEPVDAAHRREYRPLAWLFLRTKQRKTAERRRLKSTDSYSLMNIVSDVLEVTGESINKETVWRSMTKNDDPNWHPISAQTAWLIARGMQIPVTEGEVYSFYTPEQVTKQAHVIRAQVKNSLGKLPPELQRILDLWMNATPAQRADILGGIEARVAA